MQDVSPRRILLPRRTRFEINKKKRYFETNHKIYILNVDLNVLSRL